MTTPWKYSQDGTSASRTNSDGSYESRLVSSIPPEDTILPADPPTLTEQRALIRSQIDALERQSIMPRVTREALIAYAVFIAQSGGVPEAQLYAENIAYRKMKDFDAQIAALRAQL